MGVFRVTDRPNGDRQISPFELQLWSLTYSCLYKFGCPVMFNVYGPNVPGKIGQSIKFFVPRQHPKSEEVIAYLEKELQYEITDERHVGNMYYPSSTVEVMEFSGILPYVEVEQIKEMVNGLADTLMKMTRPN